MKLPNFNKNKKDVNKFDGYQLVKIDKTSQKQLIKIFQKEADKEYKMLKFSSKQPLSVIPGSYNSIKAQKRMDMEDALLTDGLVAVMLDNMDNNNIINMENKFINRKQRYMFFTINDQQVILCPDNQEQIEHMQTVVENELELQKDFKRLDYISEKDMAFKNINDRETQILKNELKEQILMQEYENDITAAQRLLNSTDPLLKLIIDKKYHNDIMAMLQMLNINHCSLNNILSLPVKDFNMIKEQIECIINGDLTIKEDAIYDKQENVIVSVKNENKEMAIDALLKAMASIKTEQEHVVNNEISK